MRIFHGGRLRTALNFTMSIPTAAFILLLCILRSVTIDVLALENNVGHHENPYWYMFNTSLKESFTEVTDTCRCGKIRDARIEGGTEAESGLWCWQVKMEIAVNQSHYIICGGAVINDEYILTAAHCVHGKNGKKTVYLGAHKMFGDTHQEGILADYCTTHPEYDPSKFHNDLALVKLKKKITYSDRVCSVCLPNKEANYAGKECIVTGWGLLKPGGNWSNVLRQAKVKVVSDDDCRKQYKYYHTNHICAAAPGKDSCLGDRGGPMVHKTDDDAWELVGIISSGYGCANPDFSGVNVNVSKYLPWIHKSTSGSKYCKRESAKKYLFPTIPNIVTEESVTPK